MRVCHVLDDIYARNKTKTKWKEIKKNISYYNEALYKVNTTPISEPTNRLKWQKITHRTHSHYHERLSEGHSTGFFSLAEARELVAWQPCQGTIGCHVTTIHLCNTNAIADGDKSWLMHIGSGANSTRGGYAPDRLINQLFPDTIALVKQTVVFWRCGDQADRA